jgi:chaperonin GroEL
MSRSPHVVPSPQAIMQLKRGFDTLARVLAVTLGPNQGGVMSAAELGGRPEVLTDAATIARRVVELPDPEQNMGAMLLRNLVWRMKERTGDGSATAAVLAQAMLEQAYRCLMAGANPVQLIQGVRLGAGAAVTHLSKLSQPVQGEDDLAAVARSVTGHEELSWVLGEMFDILGPTAYITVEDFVAPYFERQYIDGGRWQGALVSPYLISAPALGRGVLTDVQVALYDGSLSRDEEVRPLLQLVSAKESKHLLLVAHKISGEALSLLTATHQQTELKIVAVQLARAGAKALVDLQDLALLTGAELITPAMGRRIENLQPGELGRAQRAEAGSQDLFVTGGAGDLAAIRRQIELLQSQMQALPIGDASRSETEMRLGRLSGSAGVLKIGAIHQIERDFLHQKAEQGVKALRMTLQEGLLPGGGSAYLHCRPVVDELAAQQTSEDVAAGVRAISIALEAPFRQLLENGKVPAPGVYSHNILEQPPGQFYNLQTGAIEDARQAGVLDAAQVLKAALETAASGAMMALSTDTLVVKRKPKVSYEP